MSSLAQIRTLPERMTLGVRKADRPGWRRLLQSLGLGPWPPTDLEMDFDQYVLACVLSRALEEIDASEATITEATGLSRAELRDMLVNSFPATVIHAFALEEVSDPEPGVEEELLRCLLLAHARPDDPASGRFAKIIARRSLRQDHLWLELGLWDRAELSRLLATHFPTLAAGNTNNMRWKKYLYRKLCEAEGLSLCTASSCRECKAFEDCFGPEESERLRMYTANLG
ncbi:nitrogen fixation protein NifQ (plasmid) [Sinorhizobium garamanticum]|uniref:Nitrogen fixation protein NifQ n=1 Tax=Sinorhizobium garamanticum TaxID=680247 RepID=A0ABY8DR64_9HYPH|nr:nitrogen fixation protein NifQ [Sinorhizobium garamanticum]WEX91451.1 nitrogen fixation protein NifQ [Sinorhizobium garamanticum]